MPKKIFTQELEGAKRRGRPRKGWKEEVERDFQVLGLRRWRELVADRKKWKDIVSTGQSPQWAVLPMEEEEEDEEREASSLSSSQEIPGILYTPSVNSHFHKISSLVPKWSQINRIHAPRPIYLRPIERLCFHIHLDPPGAVVLSDFRTKILLPHACHMSRPSRAP